MCLWAPVLPKGFCKIMRPTVLRRTTLTSIFPQFSDCLLSECPFGVYLLLSLPFMWLSRLRNNKFLARIQSFCFLPVRLCFHHPSTSHKFPTLPPVASWSLYLYSCPTAACPASLLTTPYKVFTQQLQRSCETNLILSSLY